jgi:integrase
VASLHKREGKRGTTYRVMWRLPSGEQRSRTLRTREEASAFRNEMERLEQQGRAPDPGRGALSLTEWSGQYLETLHLKPKTRANYESLLRSRILPALGDEPLSALTRLDVQRWVAETAAEVSPSRTKAAYALLSQMLTEAVRHERLLKNPAEAVRLPRVSKTEVRPLTVKELREVAVRCRRYEPLVLWLGTMGTRWAETVGLRWDDLRDGEVIIASSLSEVSGRFHRVPTKTYEVRRLPVPPPIVEALRNDSEGFVFTTTHGNPIRGSAFRDKVWYPALSAAGLPRVKVHHLRHTCASLLIQQGANPKVVQRWLGHADIKITMDTYAHLFDDDLGKMSERLTKLIA